MAAVFPKPSLVVGRAAACRRLASLRMSTYAYPSGYSYLNKHPDEQKPALPYIPGTTFRAQAYTPPPPPKFRYQWAAGQLADEVRELHPLELCLRHPPAEGTPGRDTFRLQISRQIRVADKVNSQITLVKILGAPNGQPILPGSGLPTSGTVAAKFFDPLYYDYDEARPDPFSNCDAAFAHGAVAHAQLRSLYDIVVPRFYGTYSIDVPYNDSQSRPVRAHLYEYVPGVTLNDISVEDYSTKQRQAIMSAVLDADSLMWQQDVSHGDIHPSNIIVVAAEEGEPAAIRVIDFDMARCGIRAWRGYIPSTQLEPRSAIVERWLDKDLVDACCTSTG